MREGHGSGADLQESVGESAGSGSTGRSRPESAGCRAVEETEQEAGSLKEAEVIVAGLHVPEAAAEPKPVQQDQSSPSGGECDLPQSSLATSLVAFLQQYVTVAPPVAFNRSVTPDKSVRYFNISRAWRSLKVPPKWDFRGVESDSPPPHPIKSGHWGCFRNLL